MTQKNLVVLFGGCSPEYPVSLESAGSVLEYVDHSRYRVLPVGIPVRETGITTQAT